MKNIFLLIFLTFSKLVFSQTDSIQTDSLFLNDYDSKMWKLDSNGYTGYRYNIYFNKIEQKRNFIVGIDTVDLKDILGEPNDITPNTGISPELEKAEKKFIYYIYDRGFRVKHKYNIYIKDSVVIATRFRRGAY